MLDLHRYTRIRSEQGRAHSCMKSMWAHSVSAMCLLTSPGPPNA